MIDVIVDRTGRVDVVEMELVVLEEVLEEVLEVGFVVVEDELDGIEVDLDVVGLNVVDEVTFEVECETVLEVELEEVDTAVLLVDVLARPSAHSQAFQRPLGPSAGSGDESLGLSNT